MNHWWRAYNEALHDPKLQLISDALFRAWFNLMCLASAHEGELPALKDIAFALRMAPTKAAQILAQLHGAGLLDKTETGFVPHNWNGRQYKSDGSTERVKRFRERQRNVSETSNETKCETGPEAEQTQSRAEAEQTRAAVSNSEKVLRTDLMEAFGPSRCPDLARTSDWLAKGYAPGMIVDVVREMLARKPDIASLAYFDSALAERHAKRPPTPAERAAGMTGEALEQAVKHFAKTGHWSRHAGPEPGLTGCRASAELLAKHGLGDDGQKLREAV